MPTNRTIRNRRRRINRSNRRRAISKFPIEIVRGAGASRVKLPRKVIAPAVMPPPKQERSKWGDIMESGLSALGGFGGDLLGGPAGGAAGSLLGKLAGGGLSKLFGLGAYGQPWNVKSNSLITEGQLPAVHIVGDAGMRIAHREFCFPLYSTTGFSCSAYNINPGLTAFFPWLSQIAPSFQSYKLNGMVVAFKPAVPEGLAAFGSMGQVIIAADMNPAAATPAYAAQMEQMQFVTSGKPSEALVAPIECARNGSGNQMLSLLVRTGALASTQVVNNYDHCVLFVATNGQPSASVLLGNIYVSYDVTMFDPVSFTEGTTNLAASYDVSTGCNVTHTFGTSRTKNFDNIGLTFTALSFTMPIGCEGRYMLNWYVFGDSTAGLAAPTLTYTNAVQSHSQMSPWTGDTAKAFEETWWFDITNPSLATTVSFAGGTLPANITLGAFYLTNVPAI